MSGPSGRYAGGATGPVKFSEAEYADAGYIDTFKMKAREWWSVVSRLKTMAVPASLESERRRLVGLAESVKDAIKKVTSISDSLAIPGLSGMGALPLVPIAAVGAALAAISWWSSQYVAFRKKMAEYQYQQDLVAQGVDPIKAAQLAKEQAAAGEEPTGPLALLLKNWQLVALGVGAFFVYRMMKK